MHTHLVNFLEKHREQPFYVYDSLSHVHAEILPTPDSAPNSPDLYADNIAYMDKLVGKLVAELERLKLRENTLLGVLRRQRYCRWSYYRGDRQRPPAQRRQGRRTRGRQPRADGRKLAGCHSRGPRLLRSHRFFRFLHHLRRVGGLRCQPAR
jgi:hypothetical protein